MSDNMDGTDDKHGTSVKPDQGAFEAPVVEDLTLEHLGYQPELHRRFGLLDMVGFR